MVLCVPASGVFKVYDIAGRQALVPTKEHWRISSTMQALSAAYTLTVAPCNMAGCVVPLGDPTIFDVPGADKARIRWPLTTLAQSPASTMRTAYRTASCAPPMGPSPHSAYSTPNSAVRNRDELGTVTGYYTRLDHKRCPAWLCAGRIWHNISMFEVPGAGATRGTGHLRLWNQQFGENWLELIWMRMGFITAFYAVTRFTSLPYASEVLD